MLKKMILCVLLCICTILSSISIDAKENDTQFENVKRECSELKEITDKEIPKSVVPIRFKNSKEAIKYIKMLKKNDDENKVLVLSNVEAIKYYDEKNNYIDLSGKNIDENMFQKVDDAIASTSDLIESAANTKMKTKTTSRLFMTQHISAQYSYLSNGRFKDVKSVSSWYTGLVWGNNWIQRSYSSNIYDKRRKLKVTIAGEMEHYIMINTTLTRIQSSPRTLVAKWKYN